MKKQEDFLKEETSLADKRENLNEPNPLAFYLKQIAKYPLLTPADESKISEKIQKFRKKLLNLDEKREKDPQRAEEYNKKHSEVSAELRKVKNVMINANLRLVVSIAKKYQYRGLSLLDLIDEGNIGLIEAVERFDYKKGCKFSTYGTWWIRQAIIKSLADKGRVIRIPIHMLNTIKKCFFAAKTMTQELGRDPSNKELAEFLNMTEDKVEEIMKISQEATSLDTAVDDENSTRLGDLVCDENSAPPFENVFHAALQGTIDTVLNQLTEREMKIIKLRFGLSGEGPYTLQETGKMLGITRERVRQIQEKAISKLRNFALIKDLEDILY